MMNKKIGFIIPLYGKVPVYLNLFLKSAEFNKNYMFIFITDLELNCILPDNVKKYNYFLNSLRELIHKETGVKPSFESYYKIVDFKPAYGMIFRDYISEFDYWGMLDIDLILGDIDRFITSELLNNYDIISVRKYWLSGSFALFRNCEKVNSLFKQSKDWEEVFSSKKLYRFCETGTIKNTDRTLLNDLRDGKSIYRIDAQIMSFTHILKNEKLLNGIRVHFNDLIKESISRNMVIGYKDGRVFIQKPGNSKFLVNQEFLHYHFVSEKSKITFSYPTWKQIPEEIYITRYGFLVPKQLEYILLIKILRLIKNYLKYLIVKFPVKIYNNLNKLKVYEKSVSDIWKENVTVRKQS